MPSNVRAQLQFIMLGATPRDRLQLAWMVGYLHGRLGRGRRFTRRLPDGGDREFDVRLRDGTRLRLRRNDVIAIFILGIGEYDLDYTPIEPVRTMLDVGANVGLAAIYFGRRLGLEQTACVEASPASFALLERNLTANVANATAVLAAAAPEAGEYRVVEGFFPGVTEVTTNLDAAGVSVQGLSISALLDRVGLDRVDLLKMDIEGAEIPILERAGEWAARVGSVLVEVHPPLTVEVAEAQLAEHGFAPLPNRAAALTHGVAFVKRHA